MPRAGFAWLATPKTSVRGGYGMFYDVLGTNRITVNQIGYSRDTTLTPSLDNGQTFIATLAESVPERPARTSRLRPRPDDQRRAGRRVPVRRRGEESRSITAGRSASSASCRGSCMVEATYVGAKGLNLPVTRQLNGIPLQYLSTSPVRDDATNNRLDAAGAESVRRAAAGHRASTARTSRGASCCVPYPQFTGTIGGGVFATATIGKSDYHALQARVERRMANGVHRAGGLQLVADDDRDRAISNDADPELERVISQFDREHTFVSSGLVELPFGRDRRFGRDWSGVTNLAARRLAGRLHLQGAERRADRLRQLPVRRGHGRRRHHGRQSRRSISGSTSTRSTACRPAARLERAHAAEPLRRSARSRATPCSICRC